MRKDFECKKCKKVIEIKIITADITGKRGSLDLAKLDERLNEERFCDCGGTLKRLLTPIDHMIDNPYFYDGYFHRHPRYSSTDHNVIHSR